MKKYIISALVLAGCSSSPKTTDFEIKAAEYLNQFKEACKKENGDTWKHSLCVPMIIVDPTNLKAVSSESDPEKQFEKFLTAYRGTYYGPPIYANTSIKWGAHHWSMVLWPLPVDTDQRMRLMFHEAFHSIQEELALSMNSALNTHLDKEDARVLIRLEWNALLRALEDPLHRSIHLGIALHLRDLRFAKYPNAQKNEELLEISEGLAEYTGFKWGGMTRDKTISILRDKLAAIPNVSSLTRSSAYYSGPLYGFILESRDPQWNLVALKKHRSLGSITAKLFNIKGRTVSSDRLNAYGYAEIVKSERQRANKIKDKITKYLNQIEQPGKLVIVLKNPQAMFDPYGILAIDEAKTIYETFEVHDEWGTLIAKEGALSISLKNHSSIVVGPPSSKDDISISGHGWTLKLAPGWRLTKDKSNYILQKI